MKSHEDVWISLRDPGKPARQEVKGAGWRLGRDTQETEGRPGGARRKGSAELEMTPEGVASGAGPGHQVKRAC